MSWRDCVLVVGDRTISGVKIKTVFEPERNVELLLKIELSDRLSDGTEIAIDGVRGILRGGEHIGGGRYSYLIGDTEGKIFPEKSLAVETKQPEAEAAAPQSTEEEGEDDDGNSV